MDDLLRGCVIIPAYNEESKIGSIIRQVRQLELDCLVIDDGSEDKTNQIAGREGAKVISHKVNLGKGISLRDGFSYVIDAGYDFVITMDGDGQHHPDELTKFIKAEQETDAGIILGNRMHNPKDMPLSRFLTNKIMSKFISFISRQHLPDTQCGFRLVRTSVLKKVVFNTNKYEIESEVLIRAAKAGVKIISIPISSIYKGEKSQIHPFFDTLRFIFFVIKLSFKR